MSRKRLKITSELQTSIVEDVSTLNVNMSEQNHNNGQSQNISNDTSFSKLYIVSQALGVLLVLSVFYWIYSFRGGFGFSEAKIIFNWHPLFMVIGFIYLFANSILHYRAFRHKSKRELKNQHAIIHGCAIVFILFGAWASFASHLYSNPPIPNLYTLHSWLGVLTVTMFLSQFISGFVSFLYPGISAQYRQAIMPYHIYFGVLNFALAIATSILGFGEKLIFALKTEYNQFPNEGLLGNFMGILCVIYGSLIVYMVTKPEYKRPSKPEDGVLLTGTPQ